MYSPLIQNRPILQYPANLLCSSVLLGQSWALGNRNEQHFVMLLTQNGGGGGHAYTP